MKKNVTLFLLLTLALTAHARSAEQTPYVRGALGWGFFAEFLWVLNHLQYCKETNKAPAVYWGPKFAYYAPNGYHKTFNAWEYYFEPVSAARYNNTHPTHANFFYHDFSTIWNYHQYVQHISLCSDTEKTAFKSVTNMPLPLGLEYPVSKYHLYSEEFRKYVKKQVIDPYIKVKSHIVKQVDMFYKRYMRNKNVIGIHLRGKYLYGEVPYVSTQLLLNEAQKLADKNTIFFIATDQIPLIKEAKKILQAPVIFFPCQRFDNTTSPTPADKLSPRLGTNVLIEVLLLARCNYFVHTISNVSTAVLYFNPELKHSVLY